MSDIAKLISDFGIGIGLIIYVVWSNSRQFEESRKEKEHYRLVIENHLTHLTATLDRVANTLVAHDQRSQEGISSLSEASRRQREEHDDIKKAIQDLK